MLIIIKKHVNRRMKFKEKIYNKKINQQYHFTMNIKGDWKNIYKKLMSNH